MILGEDERHALGLGQGVDGEAHRRDDVLALELRRRAVHLALLEVTQGRGVVLAPEGLVQGDEGPPSLGLVDREVVDDAVEPGGEASGGRVSLAGADDAQEGVLHEVLTHRTLTKEAGQQRPNHRGVLLDDPIEGALVAGLVGQHPLDPGVGPEVLSVGVGFSHGWLFAPRASVLSSAGRSEAQTPLPAQGFGERRPLESLSGHI